MKGIHISLGVSVACIVLALIGLAAESMGLVVLGAIGGAIAFFVVLPIQANGVEKERHEQLLKDGKPVIIDLPVGHFYGVNEIWGEGLPDSAGGWDINGNIRNIGPNTINYIFITCYPIDRIGTRVAPNKTLKITGPIYSKAKMNVNWKHLWYDLSIDKIVIAKVELQYPGGQSEIINY